MKRYAAYDPPEYQSWTPEPSVMAEFQDRLAQDPNRKSVIAALTPMQHLELSSEGGDEGIDGPNIHIEIFMHIKSNCFCNLVRNSLNLFIIHCNLFTFKLQFVWSLTSPNS